MLNCLFIMCLFTFELALNFLISLYDAFSLLEYKGVSVI